MREMRKAAPQPRGEADANLSKHSGEPELASPTPAERPGAAEVGNRQT